MSARSPPDPLRQLARFLFQLALLGTLAGLAGFQLGGPAVHPPGNFFSPGVYGDDIVVPPRPGGPDIVPCQSFLPFNPIGPLPPCN